MTSPYAQAGFAVRFDWGAEGADALAPAAVVGPAPVVAPAAVLSPAAVVAIAAEADASDAVPVLVDGWFIRAEPLPEE